MWRGGLPPLGRAAALKQATVIFQLKHITGLRLLRSRAGASPSPQQAPRHSKLPRHKGVLRLLEPHFVQRAIVLIGQHIQITIGSLPYVADSRFELSQ
ncbi:hypothetical protein PS691_05517 [Pseudomonas fluorescens]|uniref:Uncharacterized protein n=1 Tax=Pseudomonas fluorescens TaxID=294 RepID=A0A5E7FGL0_PSEFL|nr:hypothetical protein PS691_05517 [Pseudomonas fluorescens]